MSELWMRSVFPLTQYCCVSDVVEPVGVVVNVVPLTDHVPVSLIVSEPVAVQLHVVDPVQVRGGASVPPVICEQLDAPKLERQLEGMVAVMVCDTVPLIVYVLSAFTVSVPLGVICMVTVDEGHVEASGLSNVPQILETVHVPTASPPHALKLQSSVPPGPVGPPSPAPPLEVLLQPTARAPSTSTAANDLSIVSPFP